MMKPLILLTTLMIHPNGDIESTADHPLHHHPHLDAIGHLAVPRMKRGENIMTKMATNQAVVIVPRIDATANLNAMNDEIDG